MARWCCAERNASGDISGLRGTWRGWATTCRVVNHNRTRLLLAPLAASALVLSLAACGSDDDTGASDTIVETTEMAEMADDMASDTTMADDMADDMDDDMA